MRRRMGAVVALAILLGLPVALDAQETDPLAVVNAWHDALNAYDVETALSYLAEDAVVTMVPPLVGSGVFTGQAEIQGLFEGFVAANFRCTLSDCLVEGETVTCTNVYSDDGLTAMGVDSIEGAWVATVQEGKIQAYTFTISESSLAKFPPPDETPATGGPALAGYGAMLLVAAGGLAVLGGLGLRLR